MVWAIGNADQNAAIHELVEGQNSDRIVGIVGGAVLEDALQNALRLRFRQTTKGTTDINEKLFRVGGPLGFFAPKIDLGYQLYMFEKPIRNAMYGICDIRNLFAHQLEMTFSSPNKKMTDAANKLRLHESRTHYPNPLTLKDSEFALDPTDTVRDRFFVNLKLCLLWLMGDTYSHKMWTNVPAPVPARPPPA